MADEVKETLVKIRPQPEGYHDTGEFAYKRRGLDEYQAMVFKDVSDNWLKERPQWLTQDDPIKWTLRHFHTIDHFLPRQGAAWKSKSVEYQWDWPEENIFGGLDGFFSQGVRVLDLGSGHGKAVGEINERFKDRGVKAVGLDYRYHHDRPETGKNLVGSHFRSLPFEDDSFDRILAIESFPGWLPGEELIGKYFQEITRVSKNGTIWRGTFPVYDDYQPVKFGTRQLIDLFGKNGWEVVNLGGMSFIAKLHKILTP